MSRELVTLTWCDACTDAGEQVPAVATTPQLGSWTLDLCQAHWDARWMPLWELAQQYGIRADGSAPARKPRKAPVAPDQAQADLDAWPCPQCDYIGARATSLKAHLRDHHQMNLGTAFGHTCPLCGQEDMPSVS